MDGAKTEEIYLSPGQDIPQWILDLPIADMTFYHNRWTTTRVRNILGRNNIHTLGELLNHTEKELVKLDNFGAICLAEVKAKLDTMGLKLKEEGW